MSTQAARYDQKMVEQGWTRDEKATEKTTLYGVKAQKVTYAPDQVEAPTGWKRKVQMVGRGALTVLAGPANLSSKVRQHTSDKVLYGRPQKKMIFKGKDPLDEGRPPSEKGNPLPASQRLNLGLVRQLGYDPKNRASIQEYLDQPRVKERLELSNGHYILREESIPGVSGFLFVPNGSFDKATFIRSSDLKTGESFKGTEFRRVIDTFTLTYDDDKEALEAKLPELMKQRFDFLEKRLGTLEDKKEEVKRDLRMSVSGDGHRAKLQSDLENLENRIKRLEDKLKLRDLQKKREGIDPSDKATLKKIDKKIAKEEEKVKEELMQSLHTRVINTKLGRSKIYAGSFDPNNPGRGIQLKEWPEKTHKAAKDLWEATTKEGDKNELKDNERPFKKGAPAPEPRPPRREDPPLYDSDIDALID